METGSSRFDRLFLSFLAAVIVVDIAVLATGLRLSSLHRSLYERGRATAARVVSHEVRPASRGADNHYYGYTYQDAVGTRHQGTTLRHAFEPGETFTVTYLPESPDRHVLFAMTPARIWQPLRNAGTFAAATVSVTLLFGLTARRSLQRPRA